MFTLQTGNFLGSLFTPKHHFCCSEGCEGSVSTTLSVMPKQNKGPKPELKFCVGDRDGGVGGVGGGA